MDCAPETLKMPLLRDGKQVKDGFGGAKGGRTSENLESIPVSHGSVDVVCNQQVPGIEADKTNK